MTKAEHKRLIQAVRAAEADLDAATRRTEVNAAARRLMEAKAALKAAEQSAETYVTS